MPDDSIFAPPTPIKIDKELFWSEDLVGKIIDEVMSIAPADYHTKVVEVTTGEWCKKISFTVTFRRCCGRNEISCDYKIKRNGSEISIQKTG